MEIAGYFLLEAEKKLKKKVANLERQLIQAKLHLQHGDYRQHLLNMDFLAPFIAAVQNAQTNLINTMSRFPMQVQHEPKRWNDLYNLGTEAIGSVKSHIDTVELQKNARVLGEARRQYYTDIPTPLSNLPPEVGMLIAKFSVFDSDALSERKKVKVAERAFRKPLV